MKTDVPELVFPTRADFRGWLSKNAETGDGIWLIFGKEKTVVTLTANEALEEALYFGWIDGQMKSIDKTKYKKYFARRQAKSPWSEKNKLIITALRERGLITEAGEKAVQMAIDSGTWNAPKRSPITDEQIEEFTEKLKSMSPAYENFSKMSRSVRLAYTGRYLSFKSEDARQRDFERIVERLNQNLKPM